MEKKHHVMQENLNPIAELERSSILMASTIHGESVKLLKDDMLERLQDTSQKLLQNLKEPLVTLVTWLFRWVKSKSL